MITTSELNEITTKATTNACTTAIPEFIITPELISAIVAVLLSIWTSCHTKARLINLTTKANKYPYSLASMRVHFALTKALEQTNIPTEHKPKLISPLIAELTTAFNTPAFADENLT